MDQDQKPTNPDCYTIVRKVQNLHGSTHRRTFSAQPRVGMCRQCARPRASDNEFDFGFSVPHQRKLVSQHERPDYTSRAAQSLVSEQSKQFSCSEVTS
jgi:hypothetical protein